MPSPDIFPTLQSCTRLSSDDCMFDVKFYPYATKDDDQIFAFVAEENTVVCRPKLNSDPPFEVLRWFKDEQTPKASFNSLAWTKDPLTRKPWLCIAGHSPKHVKILDIESGKAVRTLPGHGRGINDLAVSPQSTNILASGAEDNSIRLWNLEESHRSQPCVALLSGEGHKAPVLAIHFHPNGKWLLSGGIDTAVCLWAVPPLDELRRKVNSDGTAEVRESKIIYYPHFFSKELHANYVDCLTFYGDLIISRAARDQKVDNKTNEILIWKIDGFDSDEPPAKFPPIPVPGERTRSSFPHAKGVRGFQRLLTLSMDDTDRFYHRFGLFHAPGTRPILAMGNQNSTYCFWDLQRLDEGFEQHEAVAKKKPKGSRKTKITSSSSENLNRLDDLRSSESVVEGTATATTSSIASVRPREATPSDRFKPIPPHYKRVIDTTLSQKNHFATSQVAWSPDGSWMVGVGDFGMMCVFHRDMSLLRAGE